MKSYGPWSFDPPVPEIWGKNPCMGTLNDNFFYHSNTIILSPCSTSVEAIEDDVLPNMDGD
jgi:hypothetical protein